VHAHIVLTVTASQPFVVPALHAHGALTVSKLHDSCCGCAGPKDKLDSTAVSQPAIYVASLAALEKLKQTEGQVCSSSLDISTA